MVYKLSQKGGFSKIAKTFNPDKSDEKNSQIRAELESIKAEVNATFKKKETKPETKSPEKTKMAYSHTTQSMEPVEEQKYVPVKRYGLFVEEELDNGIQIRSG